MRVSLKAARVNAGLRQAQVAEKMGVSVDKIKYLETPEGSANISYETFLTLCSIYGCTIDDIILPINYPESEVKEATD